MVLCRMSTLYTSSVDENLVKTVVSLRCSGPKSGSKHEFPNAHPLIALPIGDYFFEHPAFRNQISLMNWILSVCASLGPPLCMQPPQQQEGHLAEAVSLKVPTKLPLVVVFSAVYGSPGEPSRGRGKVRRPPQ